MKKLEIIAIIGIEVFLILLIVARCTSNSAMMDKLETSTVYVSDEETLWDIAINHCPEDVDIREYISVLKEINNVPDSVIRAGEILTIYVERKE